MEALRTLAISIWFLLVILGFGFHISAYMNTKDGKFGHFFNPASIFQASLFNDLGNKYRKYLVIVLVLMTCNLGVWYASSM